MTNCRSEINIFASDLDNCVNFAFFSNIPCLCKAGTDYQNYSGQKFFVEGHIFKKKQHHMYRFMQHV